MSVFGMVGKVLNLSTPASAQADDLISWRQLRQVTSTSGELDLCDGDDLMRATGSIKLGIT
jgi:hypothetical protein